VERHDTQQMQIVGDLANEVAVSMAEQGYCGITGGGPRTPDPGLIHLPGAADPGCGGLGRAGSWCVPLDHERSELSHHQWRPVNPGERAPRP
jgi:hypothetical protein